MTSKLPSPAPVARLIGSRAEHLAKVLIAGDTFAVVLGFYAVLLTVSAYGPGSWRELLFQMLCVTGVGLLAIRSQRLWVSRLNSVGRSSWRGSRGRSS